MSQSNETSPDTGQSCVAAPPPCSAVWREFAAYSLYVRESVANGRQPWRWGVLDEEIKAEYRRKADELVAKWDAGETEATAARLKPNRLAEQRGSNDGGTTP